jgi:hypothetical protein
MEKKSFTHFPRRRSSLLGTGNYINDSSKIVIENLEIIDLGDDDCTAETMMTNNNEIGSNSIQVDCIHESKILIKKDIAVVAVLACCFTLVLMLVVSVFEPENNYMTATSIRSYDMAASLVPPPNHIERLCESRFISTFSGYSICEEICQDAFCCSLDSTENESCLEENPNLCAQYEPCFLIFEKSFNDEAAPNPKDLSNLEDVCSPENMLTESGEVKCLDACTPASCCFEEIMDSSNCLGDEMKLWCGEFSYCDVIFRKEYETGSSEESRKPLEI